MPGLTKAKEVKLKTPFGAPSDAYVCGTLEGRKVAFLARHGRGHSILPSELNFRANIHGFKQLGVERIVSMSAVGSLLCLSKWQARGNSTQKSAASDYLHPGSRCRDLSGR